MDDKWVKITLIGVKIILNVKISVREGSPEQEPEPADVICERSLNISLYISESIDDVLARSVAETSTASSSRAYNEALTDHNRRK